jgi:flavin-dependent dehydrogenase
MSQSIDVLIIGAGPAGAIAGALLARRGYRVLVLEKQQFPRFSIGESLLANSMELLAEADMAQAVMAHGFQFKNGAAFELADSYSEFNFADKTAVGTSFTFQVQRAEFDKILADEAARQGAEVRYQVEITAVDFSVTPPRVTAKDAQGEIGEYRPRFVLDASGFGRTLPRLLQLDRPSDFPVRAAIFVHVRDRIESGAFDRQKIRVGIDPNHRDVWSWLIPFSNGHSSLGIVATPEYHKRFVGSLEDRLWQLVATDAKLKQLLSQAHTVRPVGEIVGYAAKVTRLHGPGFALLGNAAEFLDPVFSSGVTIAMKSASMAAALLDRQFKGEQIDWEGEFAQPLAYGVETFRAFVTGWYDGSLQDVIFFSRQQPEIRRMICSVLAGFAWDTTNPYTGPQAARRLKVLAQLCRDGAQ